MQLSIQVPIPLISPIRDKIKYGAEVLKIHQLRLVIDGEHIFIPLADVRVDSDNENVLWVTVDVPPPFMVG